MDNLHERRALPEGWEWKRLGEVCDVQTGKKDVNEGNPIGKYCFFTCAAIPLLSDTYSFDDEAILLPGNGANVGLALYFEGKFEAYQRTYVLNNFKVNGKFIFYYLKKFWKKTLGSQYGSATNYIRLDNIIDFTVPIPPLPTQKKIAAVLEKAEKLREWRKEADGLTDRFLKSTFLEMFGDLGKNENGWNEKSLKECIEIPLNSGLSPICSEVIGGIPVFSLANLTDHGLINNMTKYYYGDHLNKGLDLEIGDILISRSNTKELVGRVGLYKGIPEKVMYPDLMIRIRLDREVLNPIFFEEYLRTDIMRESIQQFAHGTSGSMVKISQKNLMDLQLIIPPIELQQKFASIVQQVEQVRQHQKESKQQIDHFFNMLMQRAFRGELEAK